MKFIGSRGTIEKKTFSEVILDPAAPNGGLYVPSKLPKIDERFLNRYYDVENEKAYRHLARGILKLFKIDIDNDLIEKALYTYLREFDDPDVVPVVKLDKDLFVGELWHGPTRAFKDMALQPFGVIL